ncbi:MAG: hypothetical protein JNJ83_24290 [Verrucomicrobiaceae bacterium]|nr:hypothetical protein [Verrucomicrobiaceae bacterium]
METPPQTGLTIAQAYGGLWKNLIEKLNLIEKQVLTQEEADQFLAHKLDDPYPERLAAIARKITRAEHQAKAQA